MTQGGRILVVDDETLVRETVGSLLADEGYVVDQAENGADAIAKITAQKPDAILLDLMMPGMNGRQFLDALRDLGHDDVPVVVMTAVQGLAQGASRLGATDVIEKPFDLEDLLNKVALAVYRSSAQVANDPPAPVPDPAPDAEVERDRGVVLLVDRDRAALQRLDAMLSERGYTVVSLTRVTPQLPRLARALEPRAILLDVEGTEDADAPDADPSRSIVEALRETPGLRDVPILVFARAAAERPAGLDAPGLADGVDVAVPAVDEDLLRFVERT